MTTPTTPQLTRAQAIAQLQSLRTRRNLDTKPGGRHLVKMDVAALDVAIITLIATEPA